MSPRTRIRSQLAAATFALTTASVGTAFAGFPSEVLAGWVETELEKGVDATPLDVVDTADRAATRARNTVGRLWLRSKEQAEALARSLARETSPAVRIAGAAALGRILELASPAERIELVCRWTLADSAADRTAIARALELPLPVFVADLALAQLAGDTNVEVRLAATRALRNHIELAPDTLLPAAEELTRDPEPAIRKIARALLNSVAPAGQPSRSV